MDKPKALVVDLDNTLALLGDRDPYAGHLCATDTLCETTALVVKAMRAQQVSLVFLTGRNETAHAATSAWLLHHIGVASLGTMLIMRDPNDWRPAAMYKLAMFNERILPVYDVLLALDDDPEVVAELRRCGITCWQTRDPLTVEPDAATRRMDA